MFTLQILDAGRTVAHPLTQSTTSFGASDACDVQLRDDGVAEVHARVVQDGARLTLAATSDVKVNGAPTRSAELHPGDRVELGRCLLIVGRSSAARAEQVSAPEKTPASSRVARRQPARSGRGGGLMVALVVLLAVGAGAFFVVNQDDRAEVQSMIAFVNGLRSRGDLDEAKVESARLRRQWAGAEDDRLQRLDEVDRALAQVDATQERLRLEVLDPAGKDSYADWNRALQRLESEGASDERLAARKVRSKLKALITARDEQVQQARAAARGAAGEGAGRAAAVVAEAPRPDAGDRAAAGAVRAPQVSRAEIDRCCDDGEFAQAAALVQAGFESAMTPAEVSGLRAAQERVRERALAAMQALLAEASAAEAAGQVERAVEALSAARDRYPPSIAFAPIGSELTRLEALARELAVAAAQVAMGGGAAASEAARLQTLASLRGQMDKIRAAEEAGDYAGAAGLLRAAAEAVTGRDAAFAERLRARAEEASLLSEWDAAVAAAVQAGRTLTATDQAGRELALVRVAGGRVVAGSADGEAPLDWYDVDADGMLRLAAQLKVTGRPALGLAALLYKGGEAAAAEQVLAELVRRDAAQWKDAVGAVLARGRGDSPSGATYELRKDGFVSMRQLELEARSKKLATALKAAMRSRDDAARDEFVAETLARGEMEREALGLAVRQAFGDQLEGVQRSALKKQVDKMTVAREVLDEARAHAKALIYDEVRYFYPYRPPAVSGAKAAEYHEVQQEVDERVASLRRLWEGSSGRFKVSRKFGQDLSRLDWLAEQLGMVDALPEGESIASMLAPVSWARALEPDTTVTLQTFSRTPSERARHMYWRQIRAYNKAAKGEWPVAATALLKITNDYRVMFGHRPLAAVPSACRGAQGHADEMSMLGYFAHMSPTPGRKTPNDRMRLAGYQFGVSENIAMTGGAMASHVAWCHSSGHHRNLRSPNHREIGIGANGRYWVQNFGSGDVHKSHPLWDAAGDR